MSVSFPTFGKKKVEQYLQQLEEAHSLVGASRRNRSHARSLVSATSAVSLRSREAALELDDADSKLRDMKAQIEEEWRNKNKSLEAEERPKQEQR